MKSSLNHIFRTIWSETLGTWIAVSELTKSHGKRSASERVRSIGAFFSGGLVGGNWQFRPRPLLLALAFCFAIDANANPMGGSVVSGQASIAASGNVLTVTNTPGTIINWQGFSIGANEVTRFIQQSASSAVLNRVVGNNPSQILGTLQSNGR
ncbi:MAG: ESPR-type extended signal peptide-containing protein, partial [Gallionella sp.]|nr:ESPR-type extended signal peptide-containing protein [Gallionella sp.]